MKVWEIEKKIADEIKAACQPIEAAIREKYRPMLEEAGRQEAEEMSRARKKMLKYQLERALWPIGTRLVEWKKGTRYGSGPWNKTGSVGVYEIYDEDTSAKTVPIKGHAVPIIRLVRKNGTVGAKVVNWADWLTWLPAGEHPDTYEHPAKRRTGDYEL